MTARHGLVFFVVAASLMLFPASAWAGKVTCEDDTGTCTVSNDSFFCSCKGGASDGGGGSTGGGGGGDTPKSNEELLTICKEELKSLCGNSKPDEPEAVVSCENEFGSCMQYADFVSCKCGDGTEGASPGGGTTGDSGGDDSSPPPSKADLGDLCVENLKLFCGPGNPPKQEVTCTSEKGACTQTPSSFDCECADGNGGGGGGTDGPPAKGQDLDALCKENLAATCGNIETPSKYTCKEDGSTCAIQGAAFKCECATGEFVGGDVKDDLPSSEEAMTKLCLSYLDKWCNIGADGTDQPGTTVGFDDGGDGDEGADTGGDSADGGGGETDAASGSGATEDDTGGKDPVPGTDPTDPESPQADGAGQPAPRSPAASNSSDGSDGSGDSTQPDTDKKLKRTASSGCSVGSAPASAPLILMFCLLGLLLSLAATRE